MSYQGGFFAILPFTVSTGQGLDTFVNLADVALEITWEKKGQVHRKKRIKGNQKAAKWSNGSKYPKLKKH